MAKFEERFGIEVPIEKARKNFVNRVHNLIFSEFVDNDLAVQNVVLALGRSPADITTPWDDPAPLNRIVGVGFCDNLRAIEALYEITDDFRKDELDERIRFVLGLSEIDLVRWEDGQFVPAGSRTLDDRLVRDVLGWARDQRYESVFLPFDKGLHHLLESTKRPELLADVVTDVYEALEAVAKIVTGRDVDLSKNREQFIKAIKAPDGYKRILKEYIDYANKLFRHAAPASGTKPTPSAEEVESFVYLTGIFIRFAMRAKGAL